MLSTQKDQTYKSIQFILLQRGYNCSIVRKVGGKDEGIDRLEVYAVGVLTHKIAMKINDVLSDHPDINIHSDTNTEMITLKFN